MSKQQVKIVKLGKHFGVQLKYSDSLPAFVDCQKDSQTTVGNGTHVKPVLLAVKIFAVNRKDINVERAICSTDFQQIHNESAFL